MSPLAFRQGIGPAVLLTAVVLTAACGAPPLRISEEAVKPHAAGTLLVAEIVRPLGRSATLNRYRPEDLRLAGWEVPDVVEGTALALSNFKQRQGFFNEAHVYYALTRRDASGSPDARRTCLPGGGCMYGGDVVAFRVVEGASGASGPSGVNIIESVVEGADASGDCFYEDRGLFRPGNYRYALYCNSLKAQGWGWDGDEFVKRPAAAASRASGN